MVGAGAGKTTTISVLTGLFTASSGEAEVYGFDVNTQVAQVQQVMGVCPQHDILWPQLTAHETLQLFAAIKGVSPAHSTLEIARVLEEVRLTAVAHRAVAGFSGGMKRRLSVAIAALGAPRVIYLDEPTTGMDPVNRLKCWRLIQRLKRNAAVVLTTHNMEEANVLGSRVAIMAHGRLAAVGTPLRLKNVYGAGYRINLVACNGSDALFRALRDEVMRRVPTASVSLHDAANIAFTVPFSCMADVPPLLQWLDSVTVHTSERAAAGAAASIPTAALVREYSVSGPTLESVFIGVSAACNFDLAQSTAVDIHVDDSDSDEGKAAAPAANIVPVPQLANASTRSSTPARRTAQAPWLQAASSTSASLNAERADASTPPTARLLGSVQDGAVTDALTSGDTPAPQRSSSSAHATRTMYRGLCVKNLTLMLRQRGLCVCQIVTPMLVFAILVLLQRIIKAEAGSGEKTLIPSLMLPVNMNQFLPVTQSIPPNMDLTAGSLRGVHTSQPGARRVTHSNHVGAWQHDVLTSWMQRAGRLATTRAAAVHKHDGSVGMRAVEDEPPLPLWPHEAAVAFIADAVHAALQRSALPTAARISRMAASVAAHVRRGGARHVLRTAPPSLDTPVVQPRAIRVTTSTHHYPPGDNTDCLTFFLYGIDNIQRERQDYVVFFQQSGYFGNHETTHAVVQCSPDVKPSVQFHQTISKGADRTHVNAHIQCFLFGCRAYIDKQIRHFRGGIFSQVTNVNGWPAKNTLYNALLGMQIHPHRRSNERIGTPIPPDKQIAIVGYVIDKPRNLVGMGFDNDFVVFTRAYNPNSSAVCVDNILVGVGFKVIQPNLLPRRFETRRRGIVKVLIQEVFTLFVHLAIAQVISEVINDKFSSTESVSSVHRLVN
ncbi:ATP-binding cassette domain-containing protein [archaeon]|nr:MAG: ATP-binding cassette domain-containing protein [archaeon]